jgi:F-actin capping protein alpha subunit
LIPKSGIKNLLTHGLRTTRKLQQQQQQQVIFKISSTANLHTTITTINMSEAISQILQSCAPGQLEDVVVQLGKLGATMDPNLVKQQQQSLGLGHPSENSDNYPHPLASPLKEQYTNHLQTVFSGNSSWGGGGGGIKKMTTRVWVQEPTASSSTSSTTTTKALMELCSVSEKVDLSNFHTGQWTTHWTILENGGVHGNVQLHSYAYEDGNNTQCQWNQQFEQLVGGGGGLEVTPILQQIIQWEHEVLSQLNNVRDVIPENLKTIRKVLPITKTKMNWEVEAQRGVQYLKKTTKER